MLRVTLGLTAMWLSLFLAPNALAQTRQETESWILKNLNQLSPPDRQQTEFDDRLSDGSKMTRFVMDACNLYKVVIEAERRNFIEKGSSQWKGSQALALTVNKLPLAAIETVERKGDECGNDQCTYINLKAMYGSGDYFHVRQRGVTSGQSIRPAFSAFEPHLDKFGVCSSFPAKGQSLSEVCDVTAAIGRQQDIMSDMPEFGGPSTPPEGYPEGWDFDEYGRESTSFDAVIAKLYGGDDLRLPNNLEERLTKAFTHMKTFADAAGCQTGADPF